ncbi:MAG TPA: enoyl-CoA hydratase-related protein [Nitriliruptorales bacterium]|nr:enoyl-CoA hydratase-related protein [Nitriliruptorales bacterium]
MDIHRHEAADGVVTLTMDDGVRNTLDTGSLRRLDAALDACAAASAVVLAGREGSLTAGLDTKVLATLDRDGLHELLAALGRTCLRIWVEPRPVVCAATGHAVAAGTLLAMACDHAVAADGPFTWGLLETTIGYQLPRFGIALARANVRADRVDDLILPGARLTAAAAVDVGFADELAAPDQVVPRALARARALAQLPAGAYAATKRRLRWDVAQDVLAGLDQDIGAVVAGRP